MMKITDKRSCKLLDAYQKLPIGTWFLRDGDSVYETVCLKLSHYTYCTMPKFQLLEATKLVANFTVLDVELTVSDHNEHKGNVDFYGLRPGTVCVDAHGDTWLKTDQHSAFNLTAGTWECTEIPWNVQPVFATFTVRM